MRFAGSAIPVAVEEVCYEAEDKVPDQCKLCVSPKDDDNAEFSASYLPE
jgi:hypothetical protein